MTEEKDVEKLKEEFFDFSDTRDPEQVIDLLCRALLFERVHFQSFGYSRSGHGMGSAYRSLLPPKPIPPSIDDPLPDEVIE